MDRVTLTADQVSEIVTQATEGGAKQPAIVASTGLKPHVVREVLRAHELTKCSAERTERAKLVIGAWQGQNPFPPSDKKPKGEASTETSTESVVLDEVAEVADQEIEDRAAKRRRQQALSRQVSKKTAELAAELGITKEDNPDDYAELRKAVRADLAA